MLYFHQKHLMKRISWPSYLPGYKSLLAGFAYVETSLSLFLILILFRARDVHSSTVPVTSSTCVTDPSHLYECLSCVGDSGEPDFHANSQGLVTMELKFVLLLLEQAHVWAQEYCVGGEVLELGPISGVSQA